jgi:hypothetical protein
LQVRFFIYYLFEEEKMIAELLHRVAGFEKTHTKYYPRPSLAGPERCLRQLCYMARGIQGKAMEDRFIVVLDDSSWHEELTADWLRKSTFRLHSQQLTVECGRVTFNNSIYVIKGHIDGILTDLSGIDRLWEHKAINHFTFQRYCNEEYPLDYLTQCTLYLVGLQRLQPEIRECILLIKNKNTSQYLEFLLSYDSENDILSVKEVISSNGKRREGEIFHNLYRNALKRFEEIERHRVDRTLPERQYEPGNWHCDYCPYVDICWENYEEELARFKQDVELDKDTEEAAVRYKEVSLQIKELEKIQNELKETIKQSMKKSQISKGWAGGLLVSLSIQRRPFIDNNLIPPEVLQIAKKERLMEILTIREIKRKEKKDGRI